MRETVGSTGIEYERSLSPDAHSIISGRRDASMMRDDLPTSAYFMGNGCPPVSVAL